MASTYRARVDALEAIFRDPDHGREAFELLRGLIDEVRILPEDGEYRLELKGQLVGILALAQRAKNSEGAPAQRALCKSRWLRGLEATYTEQSSGCSFTPEKRHHHRSNSGSYQWNLLRRSIFARSSFLTHI
jgi:hypothetical protein